VKTEEIDNLAPAYASPSYRPCKYDGLHCANAELATAESPCWGEVMIVYEFEDGDGVHCCEGHSAIWENWTGPLYHKESEKNP